MSRGPGKWQRAILTALEAEPEGVILAWIGAECRLTVAFQTQRQAVLKVAV